MTNKALKSKLFSNSVYLYIAQIFNTIIPLLTLPYITRILGDAQYGLFSKILNYIIYFQAVVEYGFNLAGARKISLCNSESERNKIFSSIMYSKILLFFLSSVVIGVLLLFVVETSTYRLCMLILGLLLISEVFTQTWFLHGLQHMKVVMFISVIARTLSTLFIFLFVKSPDDLLLYALLYVVTNIFTAIIGTIIVMHKFKAKFLKFNWIDIKNSLQDGWSLFMTSFASKLCSGFSITVLGILGIADSIIGGYSAVQKIPYILVMLFAPIGQGLYPYICRLYVKDTAQGIKTLKLIAIGVLGVCLLGVIFLIFMRGFIIQLLYGEGYKQYSYLVIPLACWLFLSIANNFLGIQVLVARGYQKQYGYCFIISLVFLIVLNLLGGYLFGAFGVAIATMLSEGVLTICCLIVILKNKLLKYNE